MASAHRFPRQAGRTRTGGRYDRTHQQARAAAARRHHDGDPCSRCGRPLGPMGPWLHYDHNDSGVGYRGFAHAACNRVAGARRGAAVANGMRKPRGQSRQW